MQTDYDIIIIGSGAGGLTAAVALAQAGQSVLVCEQHDVPGGWCHSFTLQGYRFSPGVHYIGDLHPGGRLRRTYEGLGISQDLEFCELNPDGFDHIFVGEQRFDIPAGKENFTARLKQHFPHQAQGIDGYINLVSNLMTSLSNLGRTSNPLKAAGSGVKILRWATRTGQDLIEHFITDPILQAILAGQSGDHGLPPSQVSAFVHAGIVHHYFEGGYFPRGGGFAIPRAFVRALKRAGGEIRLQTSVSQILLENGRVLGVELADGTQIRSQHVISNADPEVTFGKLIGRQHLPKKLQRKLDRVTYSTSALSLFFAVDMDMRGAGLDSGNFWYYDDADINRHYQQGQTNHFLEEAQSPGAMFLTTTTLKDPSKMHSGHHTCEAFAFVSYDGFQKWATTNYGDRASDYSAMKEDLSWRMFQFLEKRVPGISQNVVFWSLGTPLTNEHFINATQGNLYGIDKTRRQVGPGAFPIKTQFDGLWLCGASTLSHGVAGATASGLDVAKRILNSRFSDLLTMNGPELRIYPSENPDQWPDKLQQRIARGQRE